MAAKKFSFDSPTYIIIYEVMFTTHRMYKSGLSVNETFLGRCT
jgi:hypothetical protein